MTVIYLLHYRNYKSNLKYLKMPRDEGFAWNSVVNLIKHGGSITVFLQYHLCLYP